MERIRLQGLDKKPTYFRDLGRVISIYTTFISTSRSLILTILGLGAVGLKASTTSSHSSLMQFLGPVIMFIVVSSSMERNKIPPPNPFFASLLNVSSTP